MINTSRSPLLKSGANRLFEGGYRTFITMFGNLFKRLAPGRAVKANPTCDYPGGWRFSPGFLADLYE
jgi:hypothetical protein